ncbi:MAG: methylated-DNA--[protein]-cysteine S-methyltransferase [Usitatibacter sp.]
MTRYARFASPLGPVIAIADDDGIRHVDFVGAKYERRVAREWIEDPANPALRACGSQLAEYFAGTRTRFDLPLAPRGSQFQQRVWGEIARVPYGETISYAELARRAGAPGKARAAGAATGRNPVGVVIPCHRIVGSDGSLTGYAGGLERKRELLELEGVLQRSLA